MINPSEMHLTHAVTIFLEMANAIKQGRSMLPRSANDKEYFAQDWFSDRVKATGLEAMQQGRNSYPDFWVSDVHITEGYEIKSLSFANGRPARRDIDFNSTIPSGKKGDNECFLVFFLYTGSGSNPRPVHTVSLVHGDLINSDHALADAHINVSITQFGSYGNGFIRNRKMYVLPTPITIDPTGIGKVRLITPQNWNIQHSQLTNVGKITMRVADESISQYTIDMLGGKPVTEMKKNVNAGEEKHFDVFEVIEV